ncbi:MAG: mechanosensitive ion channel family protein, partial [Acidobacteriota bacterium]
DLDDQIIARMHKPIFMTALLVGADFALKRVLPEYPVGQTLTHTNIIQTLAVVLWLTVLIRLGSLVLNEMAGYKGRFSVVQPATLPGFELAFKVAVLGGGFYFFLEAWGLDLSGWMTSAGIVGITIGLAARDSIANLFAGIQILADAPYKIGDYIVLDSGERGKVTKIGLRSTRILTRDDVEVTIPNSAIAAAKITNESGGPWVKYRIRIPIGVSYSSDIDQVRQCLLDVANAEELVCSHPSARVRFRGFSDFSLKFELLCWVEDPELRGRVQDKLNSQLFKAFAKHGIEIPFPRRDLTIKWETGGGFQAEAQRRGEGEEGAEDRG